MDITLHSSSRDEATLAALMARCFARIKEVHQMMSFFEDSSDIGRLNSAATGEKVAVFPETATLLRLSEELYAESNGAFDVMYKGRREFPGAKLCYHHTGHISRTALAPIDLGGIAKGYAVDEAAHIIEAESGVSAVINAGGDIRFVGSGEFPLSVRSPLEDGRYFDVGAFSNCAVATSVFQREAAPLSVSVIAPSCVLADSLTKVMQSRDETIRKGILAKYNARYIEITGHTTGCEQGVML